MEKYALFEIGTTHVRVTLAKAWGETFYIYRNHSETVHINKHIEQDGMIKSAKVHECSTILKMYKKICEAEGVNHYLAFASQNLTNAKNYKSFIDEMSSCIGHEFKLLTAEAETNAIYTAVINTLDVGKGVIVNISSFSTRIVYYSRRMILDSVIIPYGSVSLFEKNGDFKKQLEEKAPFLKTLDPETKIVGVSDVFTSFGKIARKMKKYPVDLDHNFNTDRETFNQVFDFIKTLDLDKKQKLKGISSHSAQTIVCGMSIIDAILDFSGLSQMVTACAYRNMGLFHHAIIPWTQEKPINDLLTYSIDVISNLSHLDKRRSTRHYELSLMLFKQIRVLHKLPRAYAKVLRIASNLYKLGGYVNNYHAILAAPLLGATHKEVVLAAFVASFRKWEDFNLAEWIKYKDIVDDEDLEAVRKLSMILAMADTFDIRGGQSDTNTIKDLSCDVLGESVILKLVTDVDGKAQKIDVSAADVEIFHARKFAVEFQKTFQKTLELL